MRYLTTDGNWRSTDSAPPLREGAPTSEQLVEAGLLHPDNLNLSSDGLLVDGIVPSNVIRLTDGPGGQPRWANYYDVMMTNPWGYGTIHTIARGLGRLQMKLYKPDPSDDTDPGTVQSIINPDRKGGPGGQLAFALRYPNLLDDDRGAPPNSPPSRKALLYGTVIAKLIYGNALWEIRRRKGQIVGFRYVPTEAIEMDEELLTYKVHKQNYSRTVFDLPSERKAERVLTPERVCHFGLWESGRRPWNPSPVRSLHTTIALFDAVTRHMTAFFNNGARLSGQLKVEKMGDGKARDAMREELIKLYQGPQNAGKVIVTSGEWQPFHREPQFEGIIDLMKFSRDEIFVTYGVPPPIMGVMDRAIMSNVREMRDQYVRDLIGPHAEFLAGDFEAQVVDRIAILADQGIFSSFDLDEQLRPDLWKRAAVFRNLMLGYTPNELRQIEHQPRLKDPAADTIWRPLNEGPLDNMPDYGLRDSIQDRRMTLEEQRFEHEKTQPASPPAPPQGGNGDADSNE